MYKTDQPVPAGCPIASLPDYRRIVLARLPPGSVLDDDTEVNKSIIDEDAIFTTDDAILLKELVAEGLLDQDELLENEPVTRPFTAMGIRPKTTQFTPFQRPSSAFKRSPSGQRPVERSRSDLTQGESIQGSRALMNRAKTSSMTTEEVKDKLRSMKHEPSRSQEVNILKLDNDEPIPERSKLARSIRAPQSPQGDAVSSDEESQTDQKHEPRILSKKKSDHALPKFRKELNPLRTSLPIKLKPMKHESEVKLSSSRQEQLLAEIGEYKQVNVPIIKPMAKSVTKSELTQN